MMTHPEPYGAGTCDDCQHAGPLVQYGPIRTCHDCTRRRLHAQTLAGEDNYLPSSATRRAKATKIEKSPERCTDCRTFTSQGANYPGAYLCQGCETLLLNRVGIHLGPVEHDAIKEAA